MNNKNEQFSEYETELNSQKQNEDIPTTPVVDDKTVIYEQAFGQTDEPVSPVVEESVVPQQDNTIYEDEGFIKKITRSKAFWPTIIVLIILIIIVVSYRIYMSTTGTIKGIELNSPSILYMEEKQEISAKIKGFGNFTDTYTNYDTSNASILELSSKAGLSGKKTKNIVYPITTGKVAIYVKAENSKGLKEIQKQVVICKAFKQSTIQNKEVSIDLGKEFNISLDLGKERECYNNLVYTSSNTKVASVDKGGKVKTISEGTTDISISNGSKKISLKLTVIDSNKKIKVTGITLNKTNINLEVGKTDTIIATITPSDATDKTINWSSDNDSIATVSNKGVIKAIGKGTANITATTQDGLYKAYTKVVVSKTGTNDSNVIINKDQTAPIVKTVTLVSSNTFNRAYAKVGDVITITMIFNETLGTKPSVELNGNVLPVSGSGTTYSTYTKVTKSYAEGKVSIKIYNYKDVAGNTGIIFSNLSAGQATIIDNIAPTCRLTSDGQKLLKLTGSDANGIKRYTIDQNGKNQIFDYTVSSYTNFTASAYATEVGTWYGHVTDFAGNKADCNLTIN